MGRAARRAAWIVAAALVVGAGAWIAHDVGGPPPADEQGKSDAPVAAPPLRTERRRPAAGSTLRDERDRARTDGVSPPRRGERAVTERPRSPPEVVEFQDIHRLTPEQAVTQRRLFLEELIRPPSGPHAGVIARDWTPAKETLSPQSGRRPNLAVPRIQDAPSDGASQDNPMDDATLELAKTHGLRGDYFDFLDGDITDVPDVAGLPPTFSRIDLAVDFDTDASFATPFVPDTFAVRWTGFLRVPEDGEYRFTCGSDDGARVAIDGKPVVEHRELRSYAESGATARLAAGKHAIEIIFYENYGYASCRLWWSGPSFARRIVATEFLTPPADLADFTPPVIASVDPASGFVDDVVTIRGVAFGGARVTFNGVPAEVTSADANRLVVKVPVGAATGDVVVQVGGISSLPRRFTVKNLLGLYAEYFKCDGELLDYPDFDHRAPYFVRLDPNLDFMDDNLWKLPYDPDVFGARFTGFLYVPEDDDYRITLGSDDGARLSLDDKTYVEMPGLHSYEEKSRTMHLSKGFHPIEVRFFENYGEARLALYWQRASDATRTVIPDGFFFAPREISDLPTPAVSSISPDGAEIGHDVEIRGSGFGSNERLVRVVFPGDVWARPTSVDDERIRVRVPYGACAGDLRVEAGIRSSNNIAFTLATQQGLVADYFTFANRAALEAVASPDALSKLTPSFTRVENDWQRVATKDWNLPFPATTFAVHWHGTLGVEYPTDVGWILRSAAGAWLSVDGQLTDDCGPWHELHECYGDSHLAPGEHRFDLWLVQSDAEPRIQLLYTPVGRLDHLPVPGRWFLPREPQTGR